MNNKIEYQEFYFSDNKPAYRGYKKNSNHITYNEFHSSKHTAYYIR
jgi:hypothetical protein